METTNVYIIGSLRTPKRVNELANYLRAGGIRGVFDDWSGCHPDNDDMWRTYELGRGRTYPQALEGHGCQNIFQFDFAHIKESQIVILVAPAGISAHTEFGLACGLGKKTACFVESNPERWDVMLAMADFKSDNMNDILEFCKRVLYSDMC